MPESSTSPDEGEHPFDAEAFARRTVHTIEQGDAYAGVLETRVIRIEEIIAARWPRSWLLRRQLRREIRASVATWDPAYIPRNDFRGRRLEAVSLEASVTLDRQRRTWDKRQAEEDAETAQQDAPDPGEGLLP